VSKGGLEDVIVAESAICSIDGAAGTLRYCGYSIDDLVAHGSFPECAWLLWHGQLPNAQELNGLRATLRARRDLSEGMNFLVHGLAERAAPMDALRTAVSAMGIDDETTDGNAPADLDLSQDRAIRMMAQMPVLVATYSRLREGKPVVPPDPDLDEAANFLWMMRGEVPSNAEAKAFDACLVMHAEHGFNASTFAARVVASTLTDIYSAVSSAIASLKGPLHGGANTRVMEMLLEIGSEDRVTQWVDDALARKERIMGFGHRVYKTTDPRARILEQLSEQCAELAGNRLWFELSRRVQAEVNARKPLVTNVDFFSASTYYAMGLSPEIYTPIFALARVAGWTAHVLEQYRNNRLMRPRAAWVGPEPRSWVPVEAR
jgi:citrate synthase